MLSQRGLGRFTRKGTYVALAAGLLAAPALFHGSAAHAAADDSLTGNYTRRSGSRTHRLDLARPTTFSTSNREER